MPPLQPLTAEVEELFAEVRRHYAATKSRLTLIALPCGPEGSVRLVSCEEDDPNCGTMKDGVFYWDSRCNHVIGSVNLGAHGAFLFLLEDGTGSEMNTFVEFSRRASALLLSANPPWAPLVRPGDAGEVWATTLMFLAPSSKGSADTHPTGPRFIRKSWSASLATIRDILSHLRKDETTPDGVEDESVSADESEVLRALLARHPELVMNVDIEAATRLTKQPVGKLVTTLIERQLAVRPKGKRKGVTITQKGISLLSSLPKSSPDHP